jgi:hypothetical protein
MNAMTDTRNRWSTALPDWAERITSGRSIIPDLPLDQARADRALRLFKQLRVPDIPGTPTYGEVCKPFVFDLVRAIFGAFDAETALRVIREYFVLRRDHGGGADGERASIGYRASGRADDRHCRTCLQPGGGHHPADRAG